MSPDDPEHKKIVVMVNVCINRRVGGRYTQVIATIIM
jgi:hypothetical protein